MSWFKRRRSAEEWFHRHAASFADMDAGRISGGKAFGRRVQASDGLIASGADAIPYALRMLESPDADIREDAGGILAALGKSEHVVPELLVALEREQDHQARDSIVIALGELGDRRAIPALSAVLRDPDTDPDTRHTAADALGRLVRRRFDQTGDPVPAALGWLDQHDH